MTREITIVLPDGTDNQQYADIAHGIWMLLQIADLPGDAWIEADDKQTISDLTRRWNAYAKKAPWQSV